MTKKLESQMNDKISERFMKKIFLIFALCFIPQLVYASIPENWKLIDSFGVNEAYQEATDSSSILTVFKKDDFNTFNLNEFSLETYIKAVPETKNFIHRLIGISNWKIRSYEQKVFSKDQKQVLLVKLRGTFLRNEKDVVKFEEWHYFYETTFLQLRLIRNQVDITDKHLGFFLKLQDKWL